MEQATKRLFVAVRPPKSVNSLFHESHRDLQLRLTTADIKKPGRIRWTSEDQMHITLAFSASFSADYLDTLSSALSEAASLSAPFDVCFAQPKVQPAFGRPKLIWTPVKEGASPLQILQDRVREAFERIQPNSSANGNRKFAPHLTMGRVSKGVSLGFGRALRRAAKAGIRPTPPWRADALELIESRLEISGATHHVLARFPFAGVS